jgi:hypothetical protein
VTSGHDRSVTHLNSQGKLSLASGDSPQRRRHPRDFGGRCRSQRVRRGRFGASAGAAVGERGHSPKNGNERPKTETRPAGVALRLAVADRVSVSGRPPVAVRAEWPRQASAPGKSAPSNPARRAEDERRSSDPQWLRNSSPTGREAPTRPEGGWLRVSGGHARSAQDHAGRRAGKWGGGRRPEESLA